MSGYKLKKYKYEFDWFDGGIYHSLSMVVRSPRAKKIISSTINTATIAGLTDPEPVVRVNFSMTLQDLLAITDEITNTRDNLIREENNGIRK